MNFPAELKYTKDHEWIRTEGAEAYIGITAFAQQELGDIVYIDINKINVELDAEEVFGTIEAVKTVSDLFMPVKGAILEVNKKLDGQPELVNTDPYGDGWIIRITLSGTVDGLLSADDYSKIVGH